MILRTGSGNLRTSVGYRNDLVFLGQPRVREQVDDFDLYAPGTCSSSIRLRLFIAASDFGVWPAT